MDQRRFHVKVRLAGVSVRFLFLAPMGFAQKAGEEAAITW